MAVRPNRRSKLKSKTHASATRRPARPARGKPPAVPAPAATSPLRALEGGRARADSVRAASDSRGKYVYCVIKSETPLKFGPIGIGGEPADVHTINYRDVAAVVSDTPMEVLDATRENVLAHERVNEAVMRQHTVIPMSFGTVFK